MELPKQFKTWIDFYNHIIKSSKETGQILDNNSTLTFHTKDTIDLDGDYIKLKLSELKAKCFDEVINTIDLDIETYLELSILPCNQNSNIRKLISSLHILLKK